METKMVAIRDFPVDTWRKIRQAAIGEDKTTGEWLADFVERHLEEEGKSMRILKRAKNCPTLKT